MQRRSPEGSRVMRLLAIPSRDRLMRVLKYLLDEKEFLSPYGIRSLSAAYYDAPYQLQLRRDELLHRLRARPNREAECLEAIPTGAARSGCR